MSNENGSSGVHYPLPPFRRLQVFSLDPSVDIRTETAIISRSVLHVPWEDLEPGPIGEYLEVIDYDPSSGCGYIPVDLDQTLATDGWAPSTGNPHFHQQMVYAVAMTTIKNFERVLGRGITWSERVKKLVPVEADDTHRVEGESRQNAPGEKTVYLNRFRDRYVPRLRIYPHALRDINAYYSPTKKALLFGYFNAPTDDPRDELPGGTIFTCLSHDIIAHETTHAILDGIHRRLLDASNQDMPAFHEAFADIVAIFQHFTLPGLLLNQIQRTRGDLQRNNLLAQLAVQFARSTGKGDALRNALGPFDEYGNRAAADPTAYAETTEPHARGAILVAAVFDAFLLIYRDRVADLRRIATQGTGILPEGDIHPDLTRRFAVEAIKAAERVLKICIRAIDYVPPVDLTFGDYLRALITADADNVPDDAHGYRLAFIEAFRERGIYPLDVRALAEDALMWTGPTAEEWTSSPDWLNLQRYLPPANVLRTMAYAYAADAAFVAEFEAERAKTTLLDLLDAGEFDAASQEFLKAAWMRPMDRSHKSRRQKRDDDRYNRFVLDKVFAMFLQRWIRCKTSADQNADMRFVEWNLGLDVSALRSEGRLEVHAVRPAVRARPSGATKTDLLVIITQKRCEPLHDQHGRAMRDADGEFLTFIYRGGCTLIIDPDEARIRYAVSKNLTSRRRCARQAEFLRGEVGRYGESAVVRYGLTKSAALARQRLEPLALVHGAPQQRGGYA